MNKWDHRFMGLAHYIAAWSKDDSTLVGCVIVDDKNRIISVGFNGPARRVNDVYSSREQKYLRTIHAELNALFFANTDTTGCTAYVTHPTCARCASNLIQNGIARVVFPPGSDDFLSRWGEDFDEAMAMYGEAGVSVTIFEGE